MLYISVDAALWNHLKMVICCFFSSFKTFAMLREATYPPAAVNVLDVSSESMAAFQVFTYGRFWVFTEDQELEYRRLAASKVGLNLVVGPNGTEIGNCVAQIKSHVKNVA